MQILASMGSLKKGVCPCCERGCVEGAKQCKMTRTLSFLCTDATSVKCIFCSGMEFVGLGACQCAPVPTKCEGVCSDPRDLGCVLSFVFGVPVVDGEPVILFCFFIHKRCSKPPWIRALFIHSQCGAPPLHPSARRRRLQT